MPETLKHLAERRIDELIIKYPLGYRPLVVWKPLRVTAGQAFWREKKIGLSSVLLITPERLVETLDHEYAHLLAVVRKGPKAAGHGPAWQQAMRDLGHEPIVRHSFDVARNEIRQVSQYRCQKCGLEFTRRRKLPRNRIFYHTQCGGVVSFLQTQALEGSKARDSKTPNS